MTHTEQLAAVGHLDFDRDGVLNRFDPDIDGDKTPNQADGDIDGDGVPNGRDTEPYDPRDDGNPAGVFTQFFREDVYTPRQIERALDMIRAAGIGWVFVNFFWDRVESREGFFSFDLSDHIVREARKRNIKLAVMLAYSARWAAKAPKGTAGRDLFVYPPRRTEDFARYVRVSVRRYCNEVRYWQIWGEPNMPDNWKPAPDAREYTALLKNACKAAKTADSSCRVVLGSLGGRMDLYLKALYELGARDWFDVAAVNPYVNPLVEQDPFDETLTGRPGKILREKLRRVRRIMAENGDRDKTLWISEIGCPGQEKPGEWWCLELTPDLKMQARWLDFLYRQIVGFCGVEKIFWYNFRTVPDEMQAQAGLVEPDFTPKPAYREFAKINRGND